MNVTDTPAVTVWLMGCVVMAGAIATELTVRIALSDVIEPAELAMNTLYTPASAGWTPLMT